MVSSGLLFGLYFSRYAGFAIIFGVLSTSVILVISAELGLKFQLVATMPLLWYLYYRLGRKIAVGLS